jgi:hypothetical protein
MTDKAACLGTLKAPYARGLSLRERIERNCIPEPNSGCWLWVGSQRGPRYGHLLVAGRGEAAHRMSWVAFNGPIPNGLHVLHRCDVGFCVNPDHLFLGDAKANAEDRERKGRGNQCSGERWQSLHPPETFSRGDRHYARNTPGFRAGENNGRANLNEQAVAEIRRSSIGVKRMAEIYGVHVKHIQRIRRGKAWAT